LSQEAHNTARDSGNTNPADKLLFKADRQTQAWIENSPVCTKIVDLDLNLQYMSSAGIADLKIDDINQYYGTPYPLHFYPDSFNSQMKSNLLKAKTTGKVITQEAPITDFGGDTIWYRSTIMPVLNDVGIDHIMIASVNVSQKYKSELTNSEARYSLALREANDGLWDWNTETGEVYYSPHWKSMLGYQEHELENMIDTWANLVHPHDSEKTLNMAQDYVSSRANSFETEMRMKHKNGHYVSVLSRGFRQYGGPDKKSVHLIGTHIDITARKKAEVFSQKTTRILEMIAIGKPACEIYDAIALMYEARHQGLRCSMLELEDGVLLHGGAPSLPKAYCEAVHGLKNGPNVGSCGTSTYTGERCLVENIETDPKWSDIKAAALPHGMRCCWSEPIKNSEGLVLGAFGMYYNHPDLPNDEESEDLKSAARLAGIVMERDHHQKRIKQLAYNDELTGLASRAHFYIYIEDLIKTCHRHQRQFSLLYIDLDNFKDVNDSLGHDVGDILLKEVSERLTRGSRDIDFIARLSGDEFCIIIEDLDDTYAASHVANSCSEIISSPIKLSGRSHTTTCSIGIAHYPDNGETASTLLKAADTALYSAKANGRNRYAFYDPELTRKAEYQFKFEHLLRDAIETKQLSLVYQPQVNARTGKIIGVEALSRWYQPELGQVVPTEFIATAERIGMIKPLTEWVLFTACQQIVSWKNQGIDQLRIAVNISPSHFLDPDLVKLVKRVIDETGIDPGHLELEVTESVVQTDPENLSVFEDLKGLGILLAIDDFGIGYSSFASLKHLNVDCLKIDKYFVDDMLVDRKSNLLISSLIEIAHNLGHCVIAEGVEQAKQLASLQELGCETVQGYLFSKPVAVDEMDKLLKSGFSI